MVLVSQSRVTLRISGDDLDPERITALLGAEPTFSAPKFGFHNYPPGRGRVARTGIWRIESENTQGADLDGQIGAILDKLTPNLDVWTELSSHHSVDMFCGLWMEEGNEMIGILPASLKALGDRNIRLELDIYASSEADS